MKETNKKTLTIGFSPCPNDTFIFDALVNRKIETGSYHFEPILEDVETLNRWALQGKLDISKISYGVWPSVMEKYRREVLTASLLGVYGQWQCEGEVRHLIAQRFVDLSPMLGSLDTASRNFC